MPKDIQKKMMKITLRIQITSVLYLICWLPVAILNSIPTGRSPFAFLGADFLLRIGIMILISMILSLFVRIDTRFPYIHVQESQKNSTDRNRSEEECSEDYKRRDSNHDITVDIKIEEIRRDQEYDPTDPVPESSVSI
jgi:hypothetical protein